MSYLVWLHLEAWGGGPTFEYSWLLLALLPASSHVYPRLDSLITDLGLACWGEVQDSSELIWDPDLSIFLSQRVLVPSLVSLCFLLCILAFYHMPLFSGQCSLLSTSTKQLCDPWQVTYPL